jgi:hypothetical protein
MEADELTQRREEVRQLVERLDVRGRYARNDNARARMQAARTAPTIRSVASGTTTPDDAAPARLASGGQLWRLNELGLLGEALKAQDRVSADHAREMLWAAASRGLWEPPPRRYAPVGMETLETRERLRLERARRSRARARPAGHIGNG